jgi:hypothetical protein
LLSVAAIGQQVALNASEDFVDITPRMQVLEDPVVN